MKVAVSQWQGRVSPVFDVASRLLLAEVIGGQQRRKEVVDLSGCDCLERVRTLRELGVEVLICGALSRMLETVLASAGIRVIPCTCGPVSEVLSAFFHGQLAGDAFLMPGQGNRRRRAQALSDGRFHGEEPGVRR